MTLDISRTLVRNVRDADAEQTSRMSPDVLRARTHPLTAKTGAIVIGGDYRGLGIVRSLGRHGIPVWVMVDDHQLAARSRYARRSIRWPEAGDDERVEFLVRLCAEHGLQGWALFPTADETAALVARRHAELAKHFTLTTSAWDAFRWAHDKGLSNQLADQLGIDHPRTWKPENRAELQTLDVVFPAILKPAYKATMNQFTRAKAWQVNDHETMLAKYDEACTYTTPDAIMVQEIIPGGGNTQLSFGALASEGRVVTSITARRTRQYPMDFGRASTFVETIVDDEVAYEARRIIRATHLTGLVEVEFKRDPRTNRLQLLDINPRVWGWHSLGAPAGVDFSYSMWRLAFGLDVNETHARPGVRWVRGMTDFPTVVREIVGRRLSLRGYLRSVRPPFESAVLALDDPLPAALEGTLTLFLILRRGAV